ncbi:MAG: glk, partial [Candidatus Brocadiaceae bacterium]|nr:glk [Candidatus Brocadiaceae bacterium]
MTDYIIGVDLGGTNIKAGLVDREGRIHRRFSTKTNFSADPQTISKQIYGLIE